MTLLSPNVPPVCSTVGWYHRHGMVALRCGSFAITLLIGSVAACWGAAESRVLPCDEALAVLEKVGRSATDNLRDAASWTGRFTIKSQRSVDDWAGLLEGGQHAQKVWTDVKLAGAFAIDVRGDRLWTQCKQLESRLSDTESGRALRLASGVQVGPRLRKRVVTPTQFLELRHVGANKCNGSKNALYIRPVAEARNRSGWGDDPRRLIDAAGPYRVWRFLERIRGEWPHLCLADPQDPQQADWGLVYWVEELQSEPHKVYKLVVADPLQPDKEGRALYQERIFDEAAAFNLTRVTEQMYGKLHLEFAYTFTRVQGVVLPKSATKKQYDLETGELRYERTIVLSDQAINTDIPDEQFTFEALGLREGESIVDRVNDRRFRLRGGEWVPE